MRKYSHKCYKCSFVSTSETEINICLNCMHTNYPNSFVVMSMHGLVVVDKNNGMILDLYYYDSCCDEYISEIVKFNVYDLKRRICAGEIDGMTDISSLNYIDIINMSFWTTEGLYDQKCKRCDEQDDEFDEIEFDDIKIETGDILNVENCMRWLIVDIPSSSSRLYEDDKLMYKYISINEDPGCVVCIEGRTLESKNFVKIDKEFLTKEEKEKLAKAVNNYVINLSVNIKKILESIKN